MLRIHENKHPNSLSRHFKRRRALNEICARAVAQQIERGDVEATYLRNRRRHLAKQVLKKIPLASRRSPHKLLQAAAMVLAMWGFAGISMPTQVEAAPVFHHINLAGFDVASSATPTFADIDGDGDLDAFVGERYGTVKYYRNTAVDAVAPGTGFIADAAGNPLAGFFVGSSAAPTFADIDGDGDLDAFVGEKYGSVKFYRNTGTAVAPVFTATGAIDPNTGVAVNNPLAGFFVRSSATPTFADIDGDGDLDAFVGEKYGTVKFYRNTAIDAVAPGTGFVADAAGNPLASVAVGLYAAPTFADIDGDGDLDTFVGERYGTAKFYRNNGTALVPLFVADAAGNPLIGIAVGWNANQAFADIDGDGDLDAFVGDGYGTVKYYRNTAIDAVAPGTGFVADAAANPLAGFNVGLNSAPTFADIDGDGDLDAFVGEGFGTVKFYRNTGTAAAPVFTADAAGNPLAGFNVGEYATPTFADIDNDGDLDAFIGEKHGTMKFFENFDPSPVTVADAVTTTATLPVVTPDVTANDTFKIEGPAMNFFISTFTQGTNGTVTQVAGTNTFTYMPNAGFAGADSFTYTLDDSAGNTAIGTVDVTVNALPPGPAVLLGLNGSVFRTGNTMTLTATTVASVPATNADVYVALQLPDGTLLLMQPNGSFSTLVTPLLSNIPVPDFTGPIFNYTFTGAEPFGNYTWFAALTTPGTLNIIGTMAVVPFSVAP